MAVALLIAAAFAGGYGYGAGMASRRDGRRRAERKVLYWVDPMHPWYKSDKPGIAPDCGMKLVPVYAGEESQYQAAGQRHGAGFAGEAAAHRRGVRHGGIRNRRPTPSAPRRA